LASAGETAKRGVERGAVLVVDHEVGHISARASSRTINTP
jgi:hypothetical protein